MTPQVSERKTGETATTARHTVKLTDGGSFDETNGTGVLPKLPRVD